MMKTDLLVQDLLNGKPLAIARAITAVENELEQVNDIVRLIQPHLGHAYTIGITGPPGSGKSTLINALISELVEREKKVAIIAVDPSSPISGGALLGDRVRMAAHSRNPNVFIRSLAAKGHLGGLTRMTSSVVDVLDAAGMDVVIIETVGTGQSEIEIADLAHIKLVICPPGLGDEMQAIKAGILEVADILVVNKADLPGAEETALQLENMLHCSGDGRHRTVMRTSAVQGDGVKALVDAVEDRMETLRASSDYARFSSTFRTQRMLSTHAAAIVGKFIAKHKGPEIQRICLGLQTGQLTFPAAVQEALRILSQSEPQDSPK